MLARCGLASRSAASACRGTISSLTAFAEACAVPSVVAEGSPAATASCSGRGFVTWTRQGLGASSARSAGRAASVPTSTRLSSELSVTAAALAQGGLLSQRAGLHSLVASRAGCRAGAGSTAHSLASPLGPLASASALAAPAGAGAAGISGPGSLLGAWAACAGPVRWCLQKGQLSKQRVPKRVGINDVIMPNTTQLQYGMYGIRAMAGKRVAAATIEAVRRTLRRKIKKTARLWIRLAAVVPVTRKPLGIRMGKGKGIIDFYATPVRPGQIIFEMDRVPRKVALQALTAAQHKFPVKLGFVEWS
ncbi:hypothetical protein HXX76_004972 [Chlamydomonas incerta]|uniref:Ribosomal protein L10e/L16 domain-containing protein n=1 Tax=Chlamydomonas incerta TaxID=51695 RepID=A0A835TIX3_CHLIN|nr:hypothetical protein HXX76_004972 [Chlamydomonas incerta]|eukprot:KAG2439620.1 hypothetical protein HXX76_004972 [Chlamydomonas incerta]